jgi:hypothetical protein
MARAKVGLKNGTFGVVNREELFVSVLACFGISVFSCDFPRKRYGILLVVNWVSEILRCIGARSARSYRRSQLTTT